jgi:DNA-binding MltR family transcriptional regulator
MGTAPDRDGTDMEVFVKESNAFMKQLQEESDRGAALAGVAFLDELLARLFKAKMLDNKVSRELLDGFGPLATFSARIKVGYCLGWIGRETFRELNLLREIRNQFAHAHEPVTFADETVAGRCRALSLQKAILPGRLARARDQFLFSAAMLAT